MRLPSPAEALLARGRTFKAPLGCLGLLGAGLEQPMILSTGEVS